MNAGAIKHRLLKPFPPKVAAAFWLVLALIVLSTCIEPGPDIDILKIDRTDDSMTVSVGPDVPTDDVYAWVSKECRDIMILPPIAPVPVRVWQRVVRSTNRTIFLFRCTRAK